MPETNHLNPVTPLTSYQAPRLSFRAPVISTLGDDDVFEVATPMGRFRMSRRDFESTFPEALNSVSYREQGEYQFPRIPYKAFRFFVREPK
jgi:hypothetical protein